MTSAYRRSFFSDVDGTRLASARAGNVIGGGDWGAERLVSDVARAVIADETLHVRNPTSVRPWQHVLNPLSGYLLLAQKLVEVARAGGWLELRSAGWGCGLGRGHRRGGADALGAETAMGA